MNNISLRSEDFVVSGDKTILKKVYYCISKSKNKFKVSVFLLKGAKQIPNSQYKITTKHLFDYYESTNSSQHDVENGITFELIESYGYVKGAFELIKL